MREEIAEKRRRKIGEEVAEATWTRICMSHAREERQGKCRRVALALELIAVATERRDIGLARGGSEKGGGPEKGRARERERDLPGSERLGSQGEEDETNPA